MDDDINSEEYFYYCIDNGLPYFGFGLCTQQGNIDRHPYMDRLVAQECLNGDEPYFILEIGSYAGMSAVTWAKAIQKYNKGRGKVFCVDPWEPYLVNLREDVKEWDVSKVMNRALRDGEAFKMFSHNIIASGCQGNIVVIKSKSSEVLPSLDRKFDLIYIDANHLYKYFKEDLTNSLPLVKDKGIICGDDLEATIHEVQLLDEMLEQYPLTECVSEVSEEDNKVIRYHPGITKAISELFNPVSSWKGFWAMRKNGENWECVIIDDAENAEMLEHLKEWQIVYEPKTQDDTLANRICKNGSLDNQRYNYVIQKGKELKNLDYQTTLEIGPDDGTFAKGLYELGYEVESIGIQSESFRWKHHVFDIQERFLDAKFDIILFGEVLEHLKHPDKAMQNVLSMAKPKSIFFISVPNFNDEDHLQTYEAETFLEFISKYITIQEFQEFSQDDDKQFLVMGTKI